MPEYQDRMTEELVGAFNEQINQELQASMFYFKLSAYFSQTDIALPGFASHFMKESNEERNHAQQLIDYLNLRSKPIRFKDIPDRVYDVSGDQNGHVARNALIASLRLEEEFCDRIYGMLDLASKSDDHHVEEFLETFLEHQMRSVNELKHFITHVMRVGTADGLYSLDQELARGDFKLKI